MTVRQPTAGEWLEVLNSKPKLGGRGSETESRTGWQATAVVGGWVGLVVCDASSVFQTSRLQLCWSTVEYPTSCSARSSPHVPNTV